jgi:serine/threonine-protein kinase
MATSILDGLNYAHEQGIIHRDVKPSNIIIEKHSKRPIITDFGIARANREPHGKAKVISGTPIYIAPEQLLNTALDHRMDIYSVGVTLFEMLVSDLPLPQFTSLRELFQLKLELKEKFFRKKPSELNPNIDREMDDIIYKALAHRPGDRYATCAEFLKRLENYGHRAN